MWIIISLAVLIASILIINYIKRIRLEFIHYNQNPHLVAKWSYCGGFNKMRKLRIYSTNSNLPLTIKVGFLFFGCLIFYGKVNSDSPVAVIETFLGRRGCDFIFATKTPRNCRVELLSENDCSKVDAVYPSHWWQKYF